MPHLVTDVLRDASPLFTVHRPEQRGDQDARVVLLETRLAVCTKRQIQGPLSLLQVAQLLPSHLQDAPQQTNKKQQQQQKGSTAPEVHVPTEAV